MTDGLWLVKNRNLWHSTLTGKQPAIGRPGNVTTLCRIKVKPYLRRVGTPTCAVCALKSGLLRPS